MHGVVVWCGFVGAWLLVAGPVYQAALELQEQDAAHEAIEATRANVSRPERVSGWWWLLPPVRYYLQRRRDREYRRQGRETLTPEQLANLVDYINKATGWLFVALGGFLIAVKETWEVAELQEWPAWGFGLLVLAAAAAALLNTAVRMRKRRDTLANGDATG